jgi:hypothetical protein
MSMSTGKPLPKPCPRVPDNPHQDGEVCDGRKIVSGDNDVHYCRLKPTHDGPHACWCGREWLQK